MQRLLTAIGLLVLAFYLIFFSAPTIFLGAAVLIGFLCFREYAALVVAQGIGGPGWLAALLGGFLVVSPQFAGASVVLLAGVMLASIFFFLARLRAESLAGLLPSAACALLGAVYCFAPWRFSIDLRTQNVHLVFFALALSWAGDSAAYYVGRKLGKHPLAKVISPKKSWEGAIASVAGSTLFGLLYLGHFDPALPWWEVLTMSVMGNAAGQLGDLTESALKRSAGVKDSGSLLPGHGGILDRLDSSLFTLPTIFLISKITSH